MGGRQSKSSALTEEWRHILWGDKEGDLKFVKEYQPHNNDIQQLRVLLYGLTGSGKSSFINSVESALRGRVSGRALEDATSQGSFTTKYRTYKIHKGQPETFYPLAFSDIMGLEHGVKGGVCLDDVKLAMKGHIKDGYTFNPSSKIEEDHKYYNRSPTLKDRVHVLVCVVSASSLNIMNDVSWRRLREVRLAARDMEIPQLAILTKIDDACEETKKDIKNVFESKYLNEQVHELHVGLGLTPNCIFPVKNYHTEIDTSDDVDTLILSALRRIINYGEDFVNCR